MKPGTIIFAPRSHVSFDFNSLKKVESGFFELSVADTGTGIPSQEIDKVFQRFHRVQGLEFPENSDSFLEFLKKNKRTGGSVISSILNQIKINNMPSGGLSEPERRKLLDYLEPFSGADD